MNLTQISRKVNLEANNINLKTRKEKGSFLFLINNVRSQLMEGNHNDTELNDDLLLFCFLLERKQ